MNNPFCLICDKDHLNVEYYLYILLTSCGFSVKEAETLSKHYMVILRMSSFTKAGFYEVSLLADKNTNEVYLLVKGDQLRNKKDLRIVIKEVLYKRSWWSLYLQYSFVKSHC